MTIPLRLNNYFFSRVQVVAKEEYATIQKDNPSPADVDIRIGIEVGKNQDDLSLYKMKLSIGPLTPKSGIVPYDIDIQVIGSFSISPDVQLETEAMDHLVHINGSSMLYSAAREYVMIVTGRGPYGPYQLPTVNMQGIFFDPEKDGAEILEEVPK